MTEGPVTTGKPGIHLAPPSFGFSQSPLPALCRQVTSYAWRSRLRTIPYRRSAEVRAGGYVSASSAAETAMNRNRARILGRAWRLRAQKAIQEAQRNPTPTRAKRYAQCGFGDKCAQNHTNHCIFCTPRRGAKMCPQTGRAKRYAQCGFVDMRGFKRVMWQQVRGMFCDLAKTASNDDNTKSMKIARNIRQKLHVIDFVKFGRSHV